METKLTIAFNPADTIASEYDWANINYLDENSIEERVGKARCKVLGDTLIIYSINIFPEYEGRGFGKEFIVVAKEKFDIIIADRVRNTAIGFWEKMGFVAEGNGNWKFIK